MAEEESPEKEGPQSEYNMEGEDDAEEQGIDQENN